MEWDPKSYLENSLMQLTIGEMGIKKLNPLPNEKILDLGCGIGNLTSKIAKLTTQGKVVGIDIDPQMISYAKKQLKEQKIKNLTFAQKDAINLTFQNEFDAIYSNIVIHWVKPLKLLFEKLYASLKVGGRIQLDTIFDDSDFDEPEIKDEEPELESKVKISQIDNKILQNFMIKQYYNEIMTLEEFQAYQSQINPNLTYKVYKISELTELLSSVGFTDIQIDHQIFWKEYQDEKQYFDYRASTLWRYFLSFFPENYYSSLVEKLQSLIQEEWDNVPNEKKEWPIIEKWPILFIQAFK
jgi:ubiquinone/menaquinone biosynthesis C-methylase UbiE